MASRTLTFRPLDADKLGVRIAIPRNYPETTPEGPPLDLPAVRAAPDRDPRSVYLASLATGSRRTMAQALERVARVVSCGRLAAEELPWAALRYQHCQAVRAALRDECSTRTGRRLRPATVNKMLSALRGVLREAWRLGQISAEDYQRASDLEPVRGSTGLAGRALDPEEIESIFAVLQGDPSALAARDAAVLALGLAGGGLRRSEICGLGLHESLDRDRWIITVEGKGGHVREVPLKNGVVEALRAWLQQRGEASGPLICPVSKGGAVQIRKLSEEAIYRICTRRARQAGLRPFTPHDMRRTYISTLLDRNVDLATVSSLVGHTSGPGITARYDRRGERARHAAAETITLPYVYRSQRAGAQN